LRPAEHLTGPHEYQAPGPGDLRSPCPFLNTLANHGYVNRDGRYISWSAAAKGIHEGYNFTWFQSYFIASAGFYTGIAHHLNPFWFDLEEQSLHRPWLVEHDASLTRLNWPDNNHNPNDKLVDQLLSLASSPGGLSARDFALHRINREAELNYKLNPIRHILSTGEVGLILPTIGRGEGSVLPPNPADRVIPKDWAYSFFHNERIPDDWVKPAKQTDPNTVNSCSQRVRDEMDKLRAQGYPKTTKS